MIRRVWALQPLLHLLKTESQSPWRLAPRAIKQVDFAPDPYQIQTSDCVVGRVMQIRYRKGPLHLSELVSKGIHHLPRRRDRHRIVLWLTKHLLIQMAPKVWSPSALREVSQWYEYSPAPQLPCHPDKGLPHQFNGGSAQTLSGLIRSVKTVEHTLHLYRPRERFCRG